MASPGSSRTARWGRPAPASPSSSRPAVAWSMQARQSPASHADTERRMPRRPSSSGVPPSVSATSAAARASRNAARSTSRRHQAYCSQRGGVRARDLRRDPLEDPERCRGVSARVEATHRDRRQQAERLARLAGVQPVLDRRHVVAHALQPPGRAGVLLAQSLGRAPLELGQQHLAHQAVHLEPPAGVEAGDEQAALLGLLQQVAGIGSSGERLGQAVVHAVDDGGRQQQVDELGALGPQHLVPQVAVDEPVRARRDGELPPSTARCAGRFERTARAASWSAAAQPPDHSAADARSSGAESGHRPVSISRSSCSENRRTSKPMSAS